MRGPMGLRGEPVSDHQLMKITYTVDTLVWYNYRAEMVLLEEMDYRD